MSGVSNWGALGLSASLVILNGKKDNMEFFIKECYSQRDLLQKMIDSGSYDGVTGKSELSVDGMKFDNEHMDVINKVVKVVKECF